MKTSMLGIVAALTLFMALAAPAGAAAPSAAAAPDKININTAGVDRIIEYRQKNGQFKRLEDLLNVRGIGEKTYERIKDRVTLGKS